MEVLLSLDLSTTCTGWSVFNLKDKNLIKYGYLKPKVKGLSKLNYPKKQLEVCRNLTIQIIQLIDIISNEDKCVISHIVIEEINKHKNRMSGKTLDSLHAILWDRLDSMLDRVTYIDSDGKDGWRSRKGLNLIFSDEDKERNKESRKLNKSLPSKQQIPIINKKHLACRFVNRTYGTSFNVDLNSEDADICDSIGLGHVFLMYKL